MLREACEAIIATLPAAKRPPAMMMALHIWSLSHGIAALFGRGDAARRPIPMRPDELLEAAVLVYLDGLGAPRGPASPAPLITITCAYLLTEAASRFIYVNVMNIHMW